MRLIIFIDHSKNRSEFVIMNIDFHISTKENENKSRNNMKWRRMQRK